MTAFLVALAASERRWLATRGAREPRRAILAALRALTGLGNGSIWAVAYAVLLLSGVPGGGIGALLLAVAFANVPVVAIKKVLRRERPSQHDPNPLFAGDTLRRHTAFDRYSFPSGHAANAFAVATTVGFLIPGGGGPFTVLAVAIAAARVILGQHYPSDILAGACLGTAAGWMATWGFR